MGKAMALASVALTSIVFGLLASACSPGQDRAIGESCECNTECVSGAYCADSTGHEIREEDNGLGGSCTGSGTCVARGGAGESCDYGMPCSPEFRCLAREPHTCELPQPEGAACADPRDCASGLVCNALICAAPGGIGDPCGSDTDCSEPLTCNQSVEPSRCEAAQSLPEGSPCSNDVQCADGLLCHDTGYCQPVGDNGATWHEGSSTCVARSSVATGQVCHRDDECTSGRCIETQSGICTLHACG